MRLESRESRATANDKAIKPGGTVAIISINVHQWSFLDAEYSPSEEKDNDMTSTRYAIRSLDSITECAHAVTIDPSSAFFLSYSRR